MADKKRVKQRRVDDEEVKPSKEEYAVAKYLRFNAPVRDGKLHGMEVKCFMGNVAVDKLMESKWSAAKNKKDPLFSNRATCVAYLVRLLEKGLFHRAEKDKKKKDKEKEKAKKKKNGDKEDSTQEGEELRERKVKKDKKSSKEKDSENVIDEKEEKDKKEKKDDKKKKDKPIKLLMPDSQYFADANEVYVWIYDPVNAKTFLIGILIVAGAISLCMFPLWPESVRIGVYYLSLCAGGFVGFILSLVVIRLILFCCIWVITMGVHHFWLLPNLTEDVGFFESFVPLYKHDKFSGEKESKKKKKEEKEQEDVPSSLNKEEDDCEEFEMIKADDVEENEDIEENEIDEDNDIIDEIDLEDENVADTDDDQEEKKTK